jgi:hypothetical protein
MQDLARMIRILLDQDVELCEFGNLASADSWLPVEQVEEIR